MNLKELKGSMQLERSVHELKGRRLVEHARNVQTNHLLERQRSARGKKQSAGARIKEERAVLSAKRVSLKAQEAEMKRQMTARVKADLAADAGQSRNVDLAEKSAAADFIRDVKQQAEEKRRGARCASLSPCTGPRLSLALASKPPNVPRAQRRRNAFSRLSHRLLLASSTPPPHLMCT